MCERRGRGYFASLFFSQTFTISDEDEAVGVEPWCCFVSFGVGLNLMAGLGLNELN